MARIQRIWRGFSLGLSAMIRRVRAIRAPINLQDISGGLCLESVLGPQGQRAIAPVVCVQAES